MRRGILLLSAFALATAAAPTGAAAKPALPATVVYELVRLRPGAGDKIKVRIDTSGTDPDMEARLVPAEDGGYYAAEAGVGWSGGGSGWSVWTVTLGKADRFLVGGVRGHVSVRVLDDSRWGVRAVPLGFRFVRAPEDSLVNQFETAKVAGGRYGSLVFAETPCGAGTYSFHLEGRTGDQRVCQVDEGFHFDETTTSAGWVMEGTVVGPSDDTFRFVVMDYPRRAR